MRATTTPTTRTEALGYLTKRFPRLSETFILDEILGLEAAGLPLRLFSIADPHEPLVQPDVSRVASPVGYLLAGSGWPARLTGAREGLAAHLHLLRTQPGRWVRAAANIRLGHLGASLKHFWLAGRLAVRLQRQGVGHLHAAFAHGPASIARYVHLLTGIGFSFSAHAKDLHLSTPAVLASKVSAAEFVLVCSSDASAALTRMLTDPAARAKIVYAPHGVDTERFSPAETTGATRPADQPLRILAVGRLVPKKGYPVLLEALAGLHRGGVEFSARIVGGGDLRPELVRRIDELGLTDRVELLGALAQPAVRAEYAAADVLVQASVVTANGDRDGIPNSVMEAMACGLPVVASSVAGIPEVVRDGRTGLLVPPGDSAALTAALQRLAGDDSLRRQLGTEARAHAVRELSRSACLRPVVDRFRARLATAPRPAGVPVGGRLG